ncbi:MAG: hypothetical protein A2X64_04830 [Ignavibacteria bacterium GWF2_33_9]|nr:MAG: hypothetical protein A2X64_04830 [Ignavibacteria bacterium GWF2_33_9]
MFIIDILQAMLQLFLEMAPYLMFGLIFVGILNVWMTKDLVAKHIGKNNFSSIFKASLFGVPLPLCSCGVIPSAVYMANNGASKSATVSFLTSTPQTGIDSIVATYGMLGPIFAIFRPIAAFLMGILSGTFTKIFVKDFPKSTPKMMEFPMLYPNHKKDFTHYFNKIVIYPFVEFLDDISSQFIIGLLIAGLITYFIPTDFFTGSVLSSGILGMLALVAIGIPMYVCATASIPIAVSLIMKGFSPGVAFVFLAAGPATNAASLTILIKTLGKKATFVFVGSISILSILFGLLLDRIFIWVDVNPHTFMSHKHNHVMEFGTWEYTIGGIFLILLLMSVYRKYIKKYFIKNIKKEDMNMKSEVKLKIDGMNCNHCVMNVKRAIVSTGVENVRVVLEENAAYITGDYDLEEIKEAVENVGYEVLD